MRAEEILRPQMEAFSAVAESVLADPECEAAFVRAYNLLTELATFAKQIEGTRTAEVFQLGLKEYQFAVLANCLGFYRQAFSGLRLTLELCLSAIEFSANERRLRTWLRGEADINWQSLVDPENGIFSKSFVRNFSEDLAAMAPQYRAITEKLYRECSEYVHGNVDTHRRLPESISFSKDIYMTWCEKAASAKLSIVFAFMARYCDDFTESQIEQLRPIAMESLGHNEAIRARFGGPAGG